MSIAIHHFCGNLDFSGQPHNTFLEIDMKALLANKIDKTSMLSSADLSIGKASVAVRQQQKLYIFI